MVGGLGGRKFVQIPEVGSCSKKFVRRASFHLSFKAIQDMSSTGLSVEDLKAFLYGMGFEPGDVEGMKETDLRELVVSLSAEQTEIRMDTAGHRNRFDVRGSSDDVQFVPPTTSTSDAHNNESSHDATLQSFCEMTAMDVEAAGHLLEACGWDVNTALSMHMEQQEEARPVPSQATSFAQRPPDPRPDLPRAQNMHDAHFMQNVMGSMYQAEGGAHMRFRDEEDEEGTTGRSTLPLYDEFGIRRPDPVRVSRLLSQPGVNNDFSRADEPSVEWLFPPPRHLSFPGTFQEARTMAKQEKKWILVNIQVTLCFYSEK